MLCICRYNVNLRHLYARHGVPGMVFQMWGPAVYAGNQEGVAKGRLCCHFSLFQGYIPYMVGIYLVVPLPAISVCLYI